jgi:TIR domain
MSRRPRRVFICHRKEDHPTAFALWTLCQTHYALGGDEVFFDSESIAPGDEFPEMITNAVKQCDIFFALIGPSWEEQIRTRAIDKVDFVRNEIAQALAEQKLVVPVLIGGAGLPKDTQIHWQTRPLLRDHHIGKLPSDLHGADILNLLRSAEERFANRENLKQAVERLDKHSPALGLAHGYFLNFISETVERIAAKDSKQPGYFLNTVEFIDKKLEEPTDLGKQIESRRAIRLNIILPPKVEYFREEKLKTVLKTLDQARITDLAGGRTLTYHAKSSAEYLDLFDFPPQLIVIDKWIQRQVERESGNRRELKWRDMEHEEVAQFANVLKWWMEDANFSDDRIRLQAFTGEQEELRWLDQFWPV